MMTRRNVTNKKEGVCQMKKQPQRTCMGCNQKKDKNQLIRRVKSKDDSISIDRSGKREGRGAYICDDIKCLEKLIKSKKKANNTTYYSHIFSMPLKNIADTNQGFADRLKKSFDTKSLR